MNSPRRNQENNAKTDAVEVGGGEWERSRKTELSGIKVFEEGYRKLRMHLGHRSMVIERRPNRKGPSQSPNNRSSTSRLQPCVGCFIPTNTTMMTMMSVLIIVIAGLSSIHHRPNHRVERLGPAAITFGVALLSFCLISTGS